MGWTERDQLKNQLKFLAKCHQALKREGWNLAFSIDIDEYLVINHLVRESGNKLYHLNISSDDLVIPSQKEASSIPKLLKRVEPFRNHSSNPFLHTRPCFQYTRKQFSNKQVPFVSSFVLENYVNFSKRFDIAKMDTFRWLWGYPEVKVGKGIVELSQVSQDDLGHFTTPHFPVGNKRRCLDHDKWIREENSPVLIHHYPSTWLGFMARNSTPFAQKWEAFINSSERGNITALLEYRHKMESASNGKVMEAGIQDWLPGFIGFVGQVEAERLLQHVGNPEMAKLGANIIWGDY